MPANSEPGLLLPSANGSDPAASDVASPSGMLILGNRKIRTFRNYENPFQS